MQKTVARSAQADRPAPARVPSPHDSLFREVFGEPVNAASLLRSVLPTDLTEPLDLDRLALCPGSFVDKELRWRHTDLLFTAPVAGEDWLVYFLIEHQSRTHPAMPYRMSDYIMRIWDRHLTDDHGTVALPMVIPIVIHHNKHPWQAPTDLTDLLKLNEQLARASKGHRPQWPFQLEDLALIDESVLRTWPLTSQALLALLLLKSVANNPRLIDDLRRWTGYFNDVLNEPNGVRHLTAFLKYIEIVGEAPSDELHDLFSRLGPKAKEAYMTTAEQLRTEGRVEGRAEVLIELLGLKFGPLSPDVLDAVNAASADQVTTWTRRLLTADTLDDVLR